MKPMKRVTKLILAGVLVWCGVVGQVQADDGRWKLVKPGVVEDTFTGAQWTQRDSMGNVNWNQAKAHCSDLSLDGGVWRLPTMNELSQVYSGSSGNKVSCGDSQCTASGHFYLTGLWFWSSEQGNDSSAAWIFSLINGARHSEAVSIFVDNRALCVRRRS